MPWNDNITSGTATYGIASSTNRYVRVIAGPGTGKSFAMKRRVGRLLEEGIGPALILPVTFTRIAAEDLHRELVGMGVPRCEEIQGTTLHSLALKILMRQHALAATGRTPRPLNDFEIKPLEHDLAGTHGGVREVRKRMKAYEAAWARLQRDEPGFAQSVQDVAFERDLLDWLLFHEGMLIGEVIPYLYDYLRSNPGAPERTEFLHILVDEFQDLNKAEQGVIGLLSDNAHVCVVGDDDQSIYSFKHAHTDGIRNWTVDHAGAADLTLDDCRRCPTTVVAMANSLIAMNAARPVARALVPMPQNGAGFVSILQFSNLDAEVRGVAKRIAEMVAAGTPPGDILVLAQRGVIGTPIFEELVRLGVPTKSYYAEAELDAQSAQVRFARLKLLASPVDRVALRFLLGVNSSENWFAPAYGKLQQHCSGNGQSPWEALAQIADGLLRLPRTKALVTRFKEIRDELDRLQDVAQNSGMAGVVDDLFPDADNSVREIRALSLATLEQTPAIDPVSFVRELTTSIAKPEVPSEITDVRIMSLHKSKGLSSPVTIIAGCIDGLLPKQPDAALPLHDRNASIEEQRRLFFVGITRVKAAPAQGKPGTLILTYSQKMSMAAAKRAGIEPASVHQGNAQLLASRFIRELGLAAPNPQPG